MNESTDNPFKVPEAYFNSFEERMLAHIAAEETTAPAERRKHPAWRILKPALTLAAMFALVFGMGYGVLSLTRTLERGSGADLPGYASAEEELIHSVSLVNYYESEAAEEAAELDEETLVSYLASELTWAGLADIYAQLY